MKGGSESGETQKPSDGGNSVNKTDGPIQNLKLLETTINELLVIIENKT